MSATPMMTMADLASMAQLVPLASMTNALQQQLSMFSSLVEHNSQRSQRSVSSISSASSVSYTSTPSPSPSSPTITSVSSMTSPSSRSLPSQHNNDSHVYVDVQKRDDGCSRFNDAIGVASITVTKIQLEDGTWLRFKETQMRDGTQHFEKRIVSGLRTVRNTDKPKRRRRRGRNSRRVSLSSPSSRTKRPKLRDSVDAKDPDRSIDAPSTLPPALPFQ